MTLLKRRHKVKKRKRMVLVDCSHILYVTYFGITERDRSKQNIMQGFVNRVLQLLEEFGTTELVFCWDSPRSIRKEKHSFYKEKRHTTPDPYIQYLHEAKDEMKSVLPAMGFNSFIEVDGYEADDTMCWLVKRYPKIDFIIVASDNDLFQIFRYSNLRGIFSCRENRVTTKYDVVSRWGIEPEDWHLFKCFGCKSDEVPGIKGIGDGYATKFLRGEALTDVQMEKIYNARTTILPRNYWLVTLPLPGIQEEDMTLRRNTVKWNDIDIVGKAWKLHFKKADWKRYCK